MTLPFDPVVGTEVEFLDQAGTFATSNLVIDGNGQKILGSIQTATMDTSVQATIVFVGNPVGWSI
jgi:hypothetical protein